MKIKGKKGISLVVLVITIIVVTIIALAVAWDMQDGGLIDNSREAVSQLDKIKTISAIKLEISEKKIELQADGEYKLSNELLIEILNKYGYYDEEAKVLKKDNENGEIICSLYEIIGDYIDNNTIVLMHFEDLIDSSLYNLTIDASDVTLSQMGKFGKCIKTNDYIEVEAEDLNLRNVWTIEWWQKIQSDTTTFNILSKGDNNPNVDNGFIISFNNSGLQMSKSNGNVTTNVLQNISIIHDGENWKHIAIVCDGQKIRVYADGQLEHTENNSCTIGIIDTPLIIGTNSLDSNGYIDELRISNVARYKENFEVQTGPF